MTVCAILQSNYLPWKGYFQMIKQADVFVFHDDVQYTRNDWRNRNILKSREGNEWISVPVGRKENRTIQEVKLPEDNKWRIKHCRKIQAIYGRAEFFSILEELIFPIIRNVEIHSLSELNRKLIVEICSFLGLKTNFTDTVELSASGDRVGKLIDICDKVGAHTYLSGPAAKNYIGGEFENSRFELRWMQYGPYRQYFQFGEEFDDHVSIVDLIAHTGFEASSYIS